MGLQAEKTYDAVCVRRFADSDEIAELAADSEYRLTQFIVRCGRCRFIVAAQDFAFLTGAIEAAGDYVRDASIYKPV